MGLTKSFFLFQVEIYRGIPFAASPVGSLRFMPPVTVTPWREIRSATHFGPVCPQLIPDTRNESVALGKMSQGRLKAIRDIRPFLANQTEDCLYLNVYSPLMLPGKQFITFTITNHNPKLREKGNHSKLNIIKPGIWKCCHKAPQFTVIFRGHFCYMNVIRSQQIVNRGR
jgi:hypothetical protein